MSANTPAAAPAKSKKMLLIIIGVVVAVLVIGGGAAAWFISSRSHAAEDKRAKVLSVARSNAANQDGCADHVSGALFAFRSLGHQITSPE